MKAEDQYKHLISVFERLKDIQESKGNDYATEDKLSNFKFTGDIVGIGSELSCLNLIATKVARLGVLLQPGKVAKNESIEDTMIDLINYSIILHSIREEKIQNEDK